MFSYECEGELPQNSQNKVNHTSHVAHETYNYQFKNASSAILLPCLGHTCKRRSIVNFTATSDQQQVMNYPQQRHTNPRRSQAHTTCLRLTNCKYIHRKFLQESRSIVHFTAKSNQTNVKQLAKVKTYKSKSFTSI